MSETPSGIHLKWRAFGSGPHTLTCLHPIGLNGEWFSVFRDTIGADYRLLCPDLRGHGMTPPPSGDFSLSDLVDDVVALWDSLDIEQSAVLGVSLGGMVTQGLVAEHPERVSAAILMCTTDMFDDSARAVVEERARRAIEPGGMQGIIEQTVARWFDDSAATALQVQQAKKDLQAQDGTVHARYWSAMVDLNFLSAPSWAASPTPTLVVAGRDDKSFPTTVGERIAARITGADLQILPGGHLFPFEYPNSVTTPVLDFLKSAMPTTTSRR